MEGAMLYGLLLLRTASHKIRKALRLEVFLLISNLI